MVLLVVKGTTFPDEFTYQCDASTPINPPPQADVAAVALSHTSTDDGEATLANTETHATAGVAPASSCVSQSVAHLINARHQLKMLLLSAQELAKEKRADIAKESNSHGDGAAKEIAALELYEALIESSFAHLKDTATPITDDACYDVLLADLRTRTTSLFPSYCTHADGTDAAIQRLYQQHDENPDLPENERLTIYHCRAIIDPTWNARERLDESTAGLWFCGKCMDKPTLREYCGRNEKSKLIVKSANRNGPAPSGEPRMRYDDQRALFEHMRTKRETMQTLEESELRERVREQARGGVRMPLGALTAPGGSSSSGASLTALHTSNLRPIYSNKQERVIGEG